jgi:hypothetical protein
MLAVVAPVLQAYVPPPLAVKVVLLPGQIEDVPLMATLGLAYTVTVRLAEAVIPKVKVAVTRYVVFTDGLTLIDAVVAPVFHTKELPLEAVKVVLCPTQMVLSPLMETNVFRLPWSGFPSERFLVPAMSHSVAVLALCTERAHTEPKRIQSGRWPFPTSFRAVWTWAVSDGGWSARPPLCAPRGSHAKNNTLRTHPALMKPLIIVFFITKNFISIAYSFAFRHSRPTLLWIFGTLLIMTIAVVDTAPDERGTDAFYIRNRGTA